MSQPLTEAGGAGTSGAVPAATVSVRRRRGPLSPDAGLLWWIGVTLPFPMVGVPLNQDFVLSATSVLGLVYSLRRFGRQGWGPLQTAALLMLAAFAATAITRHPISSFALSLAALGAALVPLTLPATRPGDLKPLLRGLTLGLWLTLALIGLALFVQFGGAVFFPAEVTAALVHPLAGQFLGYTRPSAGFSEPSHLAIFMAAFYVAQDLLARRGLSRPLTRAGTLIALFASGSLSGIVLFVVYMAARLLAGLFSALGRGASRRRLQQLGGVVLAAGVALSFVDLGSVGFLDEYIERLVKTQDDLESLNLEGSEASRINAVLALPDYWDTSGLTGFLIGTGYANYQEFLLSTYGHLSESATFARGQVDSILIAVFLSTGLLGLLAYLHFLRAAFGGAVLRAAWPVAVFVLALNFSYGYLISGLYWNLLFMLASIARVCVAVAPARRRKRVRRRPATPALPNATAALPTPPTPPMAAGPSLTPAGPA